MLGHVLRKRAPNLDGKVRHLQKQIYYMRVISSEDMDSLSIDQLSYIRALWCPYRVSPQTSSYNKFLLNSCPANVFLLFLSPNTLIYFILNVTLVVQFSMIKTP